MRQKFTSLIMITISASCGVLLTFSSVSYGLISSDKPALTVTAFNDHVEQAWRPVGTFLPTNVEPFFVLAIGNDYRPGVEGARADAIHLIGINPNDKKVTIINFPRDTNVLIPGRGTSKINSANAYGGSALTAQTLEQLTGVKISYILEADFAAFQGLINDLGGIDVNVEKPMHDSYAGSNFEPGVVHMDGAQALAFSRDRHTFAQGDIVRTENQGKVLVAALAEMKKSRTSAASRFEAIALMAKHLKLTNLSMRDLFFLMALAEKIDPTNINNVVVPWSKSNTLAPKASDLFNDFKDNAVLDTYQ